MMMPRYTMFVAQREIRHCRRRRTDTKRQSVSQPCRRRTRSEGGKSGEQKDYQSSGRRWAVVSLCTESQFYEKCDKAPLIRLFYSHRVLLNYFLSSRVDGNVFCNVLILNSVKTLIEKTHSDVPHLSKRPWPVCLSRSHCARNWTRNLSLAQSRRKIKKYSKQT